MFEFLQGRVEEIGPGSVVLDVHDVGYHLQVSGPCASVRRLGEECRLLVHLAVSENSQILYGFADRVERTLFRRLLQVNGIGPASALSLLSSLPPDEMVRAILDRDHKRLTAMKGVGRKTAERLIVELRDHLGELLPGADREVGGPTPPRTSVHQDLERVLIELGSPAATAAGGAQAALDSLGPEADFQELLRFALTPNA